MIIASCQFDPQWGDVEGNMKTCDRLLESYTSDDIDVLILPEMAFSGYVFHSKEEIEPYLEDAETGPTVQWAKKQALRLKSYVVVGYPQKFDESTNYNSLCFVDPKGNLIATYQKSFLYETDENWAEEGPGFVSMDVKGNQVGLGICMDINPKQFKADFYSREFASFHLDRDTELILFPMAWLKSKDVDENEDNPRSFHTSAAFSTMRYWIARLSPLCGTSNKQQSVVFACCNRIGKERGSEFAGNSCVLRFNDTSIEVLNYLSADAADVLLTPVEGISLE